MKRRTGLIGVALALVITGGSAVAATAATPNDAEAVRITAPVPDTRVEDQRPEFKGTGKPGASVVVTDAIGTVLCATRVTADGWSCTSIAPMGDGAGVTAVARQDAWGYKTVDQITFEVKHIDKPAVPLWVFAVGGGAVLLLVAAASLVLVARSRRNSAAPDGTPADAVAHDEQKAAVV